MGFILPTQAQSYALWRALPPAVDGKEKKKIRQATTATSYHCYTLVIPDLGIDRKPSMWECITSPNLYMHHARDTGLPKQKTLREYLRRT